jgi:hypothetical protein
LLLCCFRDLIIKLLLYNCCPVSVRLVSVLLIYFYIYFL